MEQLEFIKVKEEHLERILKWRTSEHVTRYMFTDIEYSIENQKKWFEKISNDETSKYWVIKAKGELIGLVSLNNIDLFHQRAYWAYYIGEEKFNMVGAMVGPYIYNYAFKQLKLHKLLGEVMGENVNVRKIHLMHGCREIGYYKDHIFKYNKFHDVYIYEMLSSTWEKHKEKYKKYIGQFEE